MEDKMLKIIKGWVVLETSRDVLNDVRIELHIETGFQPAGHPPAVHFVSPFAYNRALRKTCHSVL